MKNILKVSLLAMILLGSIAYESKAQANWEVGMRFGNNISIDATVPLSAAPRLHPAIYFDRFGVATYFDWMFALSDGPQGLKFYPGVGPELWFGGDQFDFDIAGDFGAEYSFDFPLTIAFDWRPAFRTTDSFAFKADRWGFSARFRFGEGVKFKKTN